MGILTGSSTVSDEPKMPVSKMRPESEEWVPVDSATNSSAKKSGDVSKVRVIQSDFTCDSPIEANSHRVLLELLLAALGGVSLNKKSRVLCACFRSSQQNYYCGT